MKKQIKGAHEAKRKYTRFCWTPTKERELESLAGGIYTLAEASVIMQLPYGIVQRKAHAEQFKFKPGYRPAKKRHAQHMQADAVKPQGCRITQIINAHMEPWRPAA